MKTITCFRIVDHGIDHANTSKAAALAATSSPTSRPDAATTLAKRLPMHWKRLRKTVGTFPRSETSAKLVYAKAEKPSAFAEVREHLANDTAQGADESDEDYEARIDELLSDCDSELYYYLSVRVTDQTDWDGPRRFHRLPFARAVGVLPHERRRQRTGDWRARADRRFPRIGAFAFPDRLRIGGELLPTRAMPRAGQPGICFSSVSRSPLNLKTNRHHETHSAHDQNPQRHRPL